MQLRYTYIFLLFFILHAGICKGKGMATIKTPTGFKTSAQLLSKPTFQSKVKSDKQLFITTMAIDANVLLSTPAHAPALYSKSFVALQRWSIAIVVLHRFYEQRNVGIVPSIMAKLLFPVHYFW